MVTIKQTDVAIARSCKNDLLVLSRVRKQEKARHKRKELVLLGSTVGVVVLVCSGS